MEKAKSIVFIGDSITDCGRTKPTVSEFGFGYAAKCIARIREMNPDVPLYNRGIIGECIGQVHARFQRDCLDLNPGLVSILIGINDVDYSYRHAGHVFDEALLARQLEEMYSSVKLAGSKLIVMETFAFHGELYHDEYYPRLKWLRETQKALADQYADVYYKTCMKPELTLEGLHPTSEGHHALYVQWMQVAMENGLLNFIMH